MNRNKTWAAVAAVIGLGAGMTARAAEPTQQELVDKLRALEAKVRQLEANEQKNADAPDPRRVDAAAGDVVRDANKRSQLLDSEGFTAGYSEGKFILRSADGKFLLHPSFQMQFRDVSNFREDNKNQGSDNFDNGFELRRMKIGFDGNVFSPDLTYNFLWATDRKSGNLVLEEAWAQYKLGNVIGPEAWSIRGGQFKDFFAHESLTSSKRLLAAERTLLNDLFTGGDNFVQGVGLLYNDGTKGGPLRAAVAFTDGANNPNQNFQDFPTNKWDFGASARVEYKVFGNWADYEDFSALKDKADLLVVGGGASYSEAGNTVQILHTLDAQYETGPVGAYAAFLGRSIRDGGVGGGGSATPSPATAGTGNFYDYGFIGQVAYLLDPQLEPFARYSYIHFDSREFPSADETDIHEITVGVNYYFQGHNAKVTVDGTWLPKGSPVANDGGGILAQPNGANEFVLRAQFQLLL